MSAIDFSTIDDPNFIYGNSQEIHYQFKAALMAEADKNNQFRNFVLQTSNVPQVISSNLFVDGEFTTSSAFSTAGFDVNQDGVVDFNAEVHFQPDTIIQEFIQHGYTDLETNQTIDGTKTFNSIKTNQTVTDDNDLTDKLYVDTGLNTKQNTIQTTDSLTFDTLNLTTLNLPDASLSKSKITNLTDDLNSLGNAIDDLYSTKQNNLSSGSINDSWLCENVVL